jgi:branched-chain amino acid transport system permease protein
MKGFRKHRNVLIIMFIAVLFPLVVRNGYFLRIATLCLIYIMLAGSLNLIMGYLGEFSLGHAAFYCIGAYTSALLSTRLGLPFWPCLVVAGAMACLFGFLIGFATLRLSGIFFAFGTLGLGEVIRIMIQNLQFTGGPMGVTGIPKPSLFGLRFNQMAFYYLGLLLASFFTLIIHQMVHSNTGRAIMSIREDDIAARNLGINVLKYKLITMGVSCFIAGVAGSFFAHFSMFINSGIFDVDETVVMITMVVIGGMGTVVGPVLGAIALTILPEVFRSLADYRELIYGGALILAVLFAPGGLAGIRFSRRHKNAGTVPMRSNELC